jgi:hypothetical protein
MVDERLGSNPVRPVLWTASRREDRFGYDYDPYKSIEILGATLEEAC